jgi:predicted MFS family arabinose efflux permease
VGVSGALSFGVAGAVGAWLGWRWALVPGALGAALAFAVVYLGLPARPPRAGAVPTRALLDFRRVLRNRSALAYSLAYAVHTWEMSALRAWVVAFLTFAAGCSEAAWTPIAPATVASVMGLLGVWASVWGNELAIRLGRRRFILGALLASAAMAAGIGFGAALPYAAAAALVLVYAVLIWSDSSSLTAGSAGSAEPGRRGAALAVHSTLGYAGGFLGPLAFGVTLDLAGGADVVGWGLAFGHVTLALLAGALAFMWLRPADLAGDRAAAGAVRGRRTVESP